MNSVRILRVCVCGVVKDCNSILVPGFSLTKTNYCFQSKNLKTTIKVLQEAKEYHPADDGKFCQTALNLKEPET